MNKHRYNLRTLRFILFSLVLFLNFIIKTESAVTEKAKECRFSETVDKGVPPIHLKKHENTIRHLKRFVSKTLAEQYEIPQRKRVTRTTSPHKNTPTTNILYKKIFKKRERNYNNLKTNQAQSDDNERNLVGSIVNTYMDKLNIDMNKQIELERSSQVQIQNNISGNIGNESIKEEREEGEIEEGEIEEVEEKVFYRKKMNKKWMNEESGLCDYMQPISQSLKLIDHNYSLRDNLLARFISKVIIETQMYKHISHSQMLIFIKTLEKKRICSRRYNLKNCLNIENIGYRILQFTKQHYSMFNSLKYCKKPIQIIGCVDFVNVFISLLFPFIFSPFRLEQARMASHLENKKKTLACYPPSHNGFINFYLMSGSLFNKIFYTYGCTDISVLMEIFDSLLFLRKGDSYCEDLIFQDGIAKLENTLKKFIMDISKVTSILDTGEIEGQFYMRLIHSIFIQDSKKSLLEFINELKKIQNQANLILIELSKDEAKFLSTISYKVGQLYILRLTTNFQKNSDLGEMIDFLKKYAFMIEPFMDALELLDLSKGLGNIMPKSKEQEKEKKNVEDFSELERESKLLYHFMLNTIFLILENIGKQLQKSLFIVDEIFKKAVEVIQSSTQLSEIQIYNTEYNNLKNLGTLAIDILESYNLLKRLSKNHTHMYSKINQINIKFKQLEEIILQMKKKKVYIDSLFNKGHSIFTEIHENSEELSNMGASYLSC